MKKKEIQKNIDDAVASFRDTLETTYLKKNKPSKGKPFNGKPFYGIGIHTFTHMFTGNVTFKRLKNGSFKISGCLPKDMIKDDVKGLPMNFNDWKIYPIAITLFNEDVGE